MSSIQWSSPSVGKVPVVMNQSFLLILLVAVIPAHGNGKQLTLTDRLPTVSCGTLTFACLHYLLHKSFDMLELGLELFVLGLHLSEALQLLCHGLDLLRTFGDLLLQSSVGLFQNIK